MEILNFIFQGFWHFAGCIIILVIIFGGILNTICFIWNRFWRHLNIRKHGYPPTHCDADGNFKKEVETKDK